MPSRYDEIHDEYFSADIKKAGTRYERLAAAVQRLLEDDEATVVHDLKLVGDSDVAHQIDVTVERGGATKRVLIECKDFDISGSKVGLDIVRSFWGVVDDIKPDSALIVSTEGFTKDAVKYAKAKGISLRVFREYTTQDDCGRIHEVRLDFEFNWAQNFHLRLFIPSAADEQRLRTDAAAAGMSQIGMSRTDPVELSYQGVKENLLAFVEKKLKPTIATATGDRVKVPLKMIGATLTVGSGAPIPIAGMILQYDLARTVEVLKVAAVGTVKMIIEAVEGDERLVFDHELRSIEIGEDGLVEKKQK